MFSRRNLNQRAGIGNFSVASAEGRLMVNQCIQNRYSSNEADVDALVSPGVGLVLHNRVTCWGFEGPSANYFRFLVYSIQMHVV